MKRIWTLLIALAVLLSLAACKPGVEEPPATEPTEPLHTHSYTETVTAPTCTGNGYTTYTCACGESYTGNEVPATGHSWGEWSTTKDPTETEEGKAERSCGNCRELEFKSLAVLSHTHKYTEAVTPPTCMERGYTTHSCACGDSYTDNEVPATGHSYTDKLTKEPACTVDGERTYTCACGYSYIEPVSATGHSWGDWSTTRKPTLSAEGEAARVCAVCAQKETQKLDKLTPSEGLQFTLVSGSYYSVTGIGTCTDSHIVIPATYNDKPVTRIGNSAFKQCTGVTEVTIPEGVTEILAYAFNQCADLTAVTIPDSVALIGGYAFSSCKKLTDVTIPGSETVVGSNAFAYCTALTGVTVENGVGTLGSYAFYNCTGLTKIVFTGTKEQWDAITKEYNWNGNTGEYTICCTDGDISK